MREKITEASLASIVVSYLESMGFDVYQEVPLPMSGGVADIVALVPPRYQEVWIVETKTSWSLDLFHQCFERKRYAHRVYAAAPATKNPPVWISEVLGVGLLSVGGFPRVFGIAPRTSSDPRQGAVLRNSLRPEHKTSAPAGTPGSGGRWTPYRETCQLLRFFVDHHPGATMKEAVTAIPHHYGTLASARSVLAARIRDGLVPGIEVRRIGGRIRLFSVPSKKDG